MKTCLVTAANSDIAIAFARVAKECFPNTLLIGVTPDGFIPASRYFDKLYHVPMARDFNHYKEKLEEIIDAHAVDVVCPISEPEIREYYQHNYLPVRHTLINPPFILKTFLDKYFTHIWLKSIDVPTPDTLMLDSDFPEKYTRCIVKPRNGAGSRHLFNVENKQLYEALQHTFKDELNEFVVQRYVGSENDEYTCAIWHFNGDYREIVLKRKLLSGVTSQAEIVKNRVISEVLERIAKHLGGDFFINVQLRLEDNKPYVFEINPRFSSTVMMRHKVGFKDVFWSLLEMSNSEMPVYRSPLVGQTIFRNSEELVF